MQNQYCHSQVKQIYELVFDSGTTLSKLATMKKKITVYACPVTEWKF